MQRCLQGAARLPRTRALRVSASAEDKRGGEEWAVIPARPRSAAEESGAAALSEAATRLASPRVSLKSGKARLFWSGNPVIYGNSVDRVAGSPANGDAVLVTDHTGSALGWGVFNPHSMYRVRLLGSHAEAAQASGLLDVEATLRTRLLAAAQLRRRLGLPCADTDVYRLVNSEGDRLSGLTADVFGSYIVCQSGAHWLERRRAAVVSALLEAVPGAQAVLWRPVVDMLRKETGEEKGGSGPAPQPVLFRRGCGESSLDAADLPPRIQVVENGVRYYVALASGQKTGFYADQRESRARVRSMAHAAGPGCTVLDTCCYSGGFALSAALGGAAQMTGVDSSAAAIELARANAALNGFAEDGPVRFVVGDVMEVLEEAVAAGRTYDIVILDPPKLCPTRALLPRASSRYRKLNSLAARCVAPGGVLVSCSCSGAMTQSGLFPTLVADSVAAAGRTGALLVKAGAAPCHVQCAGYGEGDYLTALFFVLQ